MSKTLYLHITFSGPEVAPRRNYYPSYVLNEDLFFDGIKTSYSKYSLVDDYEQGSGWLWYWYTNSFDQATFARPSDFNTAKLSYPDPDGTVLTGFRAWITIQVPDDYNIPPEFDKGELFGDFHFPTPDNTSISVGPLSVDLSANRFGGMTFDTLVDYAVKSAPSLLEFALKRAGFSGLATAISNVQVARDALLSFHSDGIGLIVEGINSIGDPNYDSRALLQAIDAYIAGAEGRFSDAFDDVVLIPGNDLADRAAHELVRALGVVGSSNVGANGAVTLEELNVTGSWASPITTSATAKFGFVAGGEGDFVIRGQSTKNTLVGGPGRNEIYGGNGGDYLNGAAGDDSLYGGSGSDTLIGGKGQDNLSGGLGNDVFSDTISHFNGDRIMDFVKGDVIRIADAVSSSFSFSYEGGTIQFGGSSIEIGGLPQGQSIVAEAGPEGGVEIQIVGDAVVPVSPTFRMFAPEGYSGAIGGQGTIFGTVGPQDITVMNRPGKVTLDASFNRGSDIIRLEGFASSFSVSVEGSFAKFSDLDSEVYVPIGNATWIAFFDDARQLFYDSFSRAFVLGEQVLTEVPSAVDAAGTLATIIDHYPSNGTKARVFVPEEGEISVDGDVAIFGTPGTQRIFIQDGDVQFDASFNRGGDLIFFEPFAGAFQASVSGSLVILDDGFRSATIPYGAVGATLVFGLMPRTLVYDAASEIVMIGTQAITESAAYLIA